MILCQLFFRLQKLTPYDSTTSFFKSDNRVISMFPNPSSALSLFVYSIWVKWESIEHPKTSQLCSENFCIVGEFNNFCWTKKSEIKWIKEKLLIFVLKVISWEHLEGLSTRIPWVKIEEWCSLTNSSSDIFSVYLCYSWFYQNFISFDWTISYTLNPYLNTLFINDCIAIWWLDDYLLALSDHIHIFYHLSFVFWDILWCVSNQFHRSSA